MFSFGSKLLFLFLLAFPCALTSVGESHFCSFCRPFFKVLVFNDVIATGENLDVACSHICAQQLEINCSDTVAGLLMGV